MITITRTRRSGAKHDYTIYEPGDVIPPTLRVVRYSNRHSAMKGELVTDINGRMVPLLRRILIDKQKKHTLMIFPGFCWQPWVQDIFSYPIDKAQAPDASPALTARHMAFAGLISEGVPVEMAVTKVWPKARGKEGMAMVRRIFAQRSFLHYLLVEIGYVKQLKDALEKRNISIDTIATQISDLIENERVNPTLKKWALETALAAFETPVAEKKTLMEYRQETSLTIDEVMAERMASKNLPPAHTELLSPAAVRFLDSADTSAAEADAGDIEI